jgi:hypothetical protein
MATDRLRRGGFLFSEVEAFFSNFDHSPNPITLHKSLFLKAKIHKLTVLFMVYGYNIYIVLWLELMK